MQRIRLISRLAVVALTIAACSSDDDATNASAASTSSTTATFATPTSSTPSGREIHATSTADSTKVGDSICDSQQHCMIPLSVTGTYTGDLSGTSISHGAGALVGTKYAAGGTLIFTGAVAGCGTGTMVIVDTGVGSTDGTATSEWEIVDGFGSGDLARVQGSGTTTTAKSSDGSFTATLTGRITCD